MSSGAANLNEEITDGLHSAQIIGVSFLVLVVTTQFLRIYVRARMIKHFGWDDWAMCAATVCYICFTALGHQLTVVGLSSLTDPSLTDDAMIWRRPFSLFYSLAMALWKISVALFFYKIFQHRPVERTIIWVVAGLTTCAAIAYGVGAAFTCASPKTYEPLTSHCEAQRPVEIIFIIFSVVNILGNVVYAIIAVSAISKAKLPLITKVTATLLVLLGTCGCVATIIRLYWLVQPSTLVTYTSISVNVLRWAVIELGLSLSATNLGTLRPIFDSVLKRCRLIATTKHDGTAGTMSQKRHRFNTTSGTPKGALYGDEEDIALVSAIRKDVVVAMNEEAADPSIPQRPRGEPPWASSARHDRPEAAYVDSLPYHPRSDESGRGDHTKPSNIRKGQSFLDT